MSRDDNMRSNTYGLTSPSAKLRQKVGARPSSGAKRKPEPPKRKLSAAKQALPFEPRSISPAAREAQRASRRDGEGPPLRSMLAVAREMVAKNLDISAAAMIAI